MKKKVLLILFFFTILISFSQEKFGAPYFTGAANVTFAVNEHYTLEPDDGESLLIPSAIFLRMGFGYEFKKRIALSLNGGFDFGNGLNAVNPDDIDIYRQLAGGVTAAQLLHGSANPIGGQSALIKLKWGVSPEEMLIPNAPKFIKCALGENVKQAKWGDFNTIRFPQTRMGVEQVFYDGFYRAKA